MKQDGFDPLHPLGADAVTELDHRSRIQNLTPLEGVEPAEALPVSVLMEHLHRSVIRTVVAVLQNVDAHHQTNRFAVTANGTVVNRQGFVESIPIDQMSGAEKFMLRIEDIREKSLKHKKLPLWDICFHINSLYHIPEGKTSLFQQLSSVFKEPILCLRGLQTAFFRTD
jgi:hypothetical protein